VHRNSRLKKSNKMQQYSDIYLLLNCSTCFGRPLRTSSGVYKTVVAASGTDHTVWGASFLKRDQVSSLPRQYDLYHRLQLQFYVLLMMGAMDARNMYSNLAVNKYLHSAASRWIYLTFIISVRDKQCVFSSRASRNLAKSLRQTHLKDALQCYPQACLGR
jgi:hypothetical protein